MGDIVALTFLRLFDPFVVVPGVPSFVRFVASCICMYKFFGVFVLFLGGDCFTLSPGLCLL